MRTLRSKLIVLLIFSALTPLAVFGALSLYNFQKALRSSIEESFQEISVRAAEEIKLFLDNARTILETLAADLTETELNEQQTQRILENYVIRFPAFLKIHYYDQNFKLKLSTSLKGSDADKPETKLLNLAKNKVFLTSQPYLSEDLTPVIWFLVSTTNKEQKSGTFAAQIDLMQMWKWVSDTKLGEKGYASVVDPLGMVVASGDPYLKRAILSSEKAVHYDEVADLSGLEQKPSVLKTLRGMVLINATKILSQPEWYLILSQPTREAFAAVRTISYVLGALIIFFLIVMVVVAVGGTQRMLLSPLEKLMKATQAIGQGKLGYKIKNLGPDELGQLGQSINTMSKDLADLQETTRRQERMAMFGRMASGLAHDLKHPVKNVENAAKIMEVNYQDEAYRQKFTNIVKREFKRINEFLEDLRNLTHEMSFHPLSFNLVQVLQEIQESFQTEAEKRSASIELKFNDSFPKIMGDPNLLRRVFENLVSNALQALQDKNGKISIILKDDGGSLTAQVRDTGCGIPPERLPGLFDEFTTTKRRGLGLGLAIAKKIMGLHKGDIEVESSLGVGTTFSLKFPKNLG